MEDDVSKAKGSKEKNKIKKQADEKKRAAVESKTNKTSSPLTALGESRKGK
jgi:hypothetical protein